MSRSYHITRREAVRRFKEGDSSGMLEKWEKRTTKQGVRKFRPVFDKIHPSAKPDSKLRVSTVQRATKAYLKGRLAQKKEKGNA